MFSVRTILHPTDFSEQSEMAFRMACALARDYNARLVFLHVVAPPVIVFGEGVLPIDPTDYRRGADEGLAQLAARAAWAETESRLAEGDPVTEILASARDCQADLIVMGTHGRTALAHLLMGSIAEKVVRRASCPVLTVKAPLAENVPALAGAEEHAAITGR
jgi:universal stress protein A